MVARRKLGTLDGGDQALAFTTDVAAFVVVANQTLHELHRVIAHDVVNRCVVGCGLLEEISNVLEQ